MGQLNNNTPTEQNTTIDQANNLGATVFSGGEDVEISPIDGKVYVAIKNEKRIYRFHDNSPLSGGSISNFESFVGDTTYVLNTEQGLDTVSWGTGNDNLAFDDLGNLWVLQDGSDDHIWFVELGHSPSSPKVKIFGHSPAGSEPTGITFTPDYKYLFMSFQHASSANSSSNQPDAFQEPRMFDKDVAVVISRKQFLGNCHLNQNINHNINSIDSFHVSQHLICSSILQSNANVKLNAGQEISLNSGFEIIPGGSLSIEVNNCTVITP